MQTSEQFSEPPKEIGISKNFRNTPAENTKKIGGTLRPRKPTAKAVLSDYPESIAKTPNRKTKLVLAIPTADELPPQTVPFEANDSENQKYRFAQVAPYENSLCSPGFIRGHSETHTFFKIIYCGREWCPFCGAYLSPVHIRRIARLTEKTVQLNLANYWVVTIPEELRHLFGKQDFNAMRSYIVQKLKRTYPGTRGFSRWHWAGDKHPKKFAPHLNVLFEGPGWIEPANLDKFRRELSAWFKAYFKLHYFPAPNFFTRYSSSPEKIKHWTNYISRATFMGNAATIQDLIKGYRNTAPFGKFDKPTNESTDPLNQALKGIDITDGTRIIWERQQKIVVKEWIDKETGEVIKADFASYPVILHPARNYKSVVLEHPDREHIGGGILRLKRQNLEKPPD